MATKLFLENFENENISLKIQPQNGMYLLDESHIEALKFRINSLNEHDKNMSSYLIKNGYSPEAFKSSLKSLSIRSYYFPKIIEVLEQSQTNSYDSPIKSIINLFRKINDKFALNYCGFIFSREVDKKEIMRNYQFHNLKWKFDDLAELNINNIEENIQYFQKIMHTIGVNLPIPQGYDDKNIENTLKNKVLEQIYSQGFQEIRKVNYDVINYLENNNDIQPNETKTFQPKL